ncbi:hypothetical protein DERP_004058 [Dermatophagoides pteronyssinus]|uniref:C2H2-type domain-containing protein n=1 Tax=Dermatophagoides pteronyssinus TaxID=6956 RepID=A0ABQ8J812_DERPT|nr:hypothetical protein DERP_004058 [Dermatophagoides pteronyssinus]
MLSADTNNNKSSGLYTCQTCNSIFTCLNYYQKHRQQHAETEGVKLLTCLHCTYVSDNGFHYNWHIMSHASSPPHRCDVCDPNSQSTNNDQFLTTSSLTTSTASTATTILSSSSSTNQFKQNVANFSDSNHHHHNNHSSYHHFPNNNGASINGIDQTSITNRISNTIISNDGKCRSISTETDDDLILESQLYSPIPGDESPCPTFDEDLDQQRPPQLNISSKSFNLSSSNQHQQLSSLSHHHQHHLQPERFLNQAHHLHQHHQSITQGLPTLQINNSNANGNDQQHQTQSIHHNSNAQSSLNQNHPAASFTIAHPNFIFPNAAAATVATGQLLTTGPHSQNNPNAATAAVASPNAQGAAAIFNPNATFTAANGQMVQLVSLQPFTHHTGDSGQTATQYLQSAQTNSGTPIDTGLPGLSRLPSSVPNKKVHSQLPSTKTSKTQQVSSGLVFAKKTPKSNKSHSSSSSNNNTNLAVSSRNESLSPTELANSLGTTITKIVSPSDYKPMKGKGKGNRKPRISFISVVNGITLGSDGIRRKFHCSHCGNGKSFKTKSHLQRHMLTHTGEKPYQCQECGAKFNQSSSLRNHIIAIHTKRFPHTCTTCGKGFLMPAVLQKHISATGHQSEI